MSIRHALFIDGAWTDAGMDSWSALVTVHETGIKIIPYCDSDGMIIDMVQFSFEEFAAIVEMVAKARGEPQP